MTTLVEHPTSHSLIIRSFYIEHDDLVISWTVPSLHSIQYTITSCQRSRLTIFVKTPSIFSRSYATPQNNSFSHASRPIIHPFARLFPLPAGTNARLAMTDTTEMPCHAWSCRMGHQRQVDPLHAGSSEVTHKRRMQDERNDSDALSCLGICAL